MNRRRNSPLFRKFEEAASRNLGHSATARMLRDAERYAGVGTQARQDVKTMRERLLDATIRKLGPLGDLLKALLRPSGRSIADPAKELAAAANLLDVFGPRPSVSPREKGAAREALAETLARHGFHVGPPPRTGGRSVASPAPDDEPGFRAWAGSTSRPAGNAIDVRIGSRVKRMRQDDPALTGEMIEVQSSNVHSIGYAWNWDDATKGTLKVRFLQDGAGGKKSGPGPVYWYYGVHPDLFAKFRLAASKGKFVWDRLRVRGTVSGHQFQYALKGVTNGYVPRKATRLGPNEYFLKRSMKARSVRTGEVRELTSRHADRLVNRGVPNRGAPNRGR